MLLHLQSVLLDLKTSFGHELRLSIILLGLNDVYNVTITRKSGSLSFG